MYRRLLLIAAAIGLTGAIGASLLPIATPPGPWDRVAHFGLYAAIGACAAIALGRRAAWALAAGLIALGGLVEVAQLYIPRRDASVEDALVSALGVLLGIALGRFLSRRMT